MIDDNKSHKMSNNASLIRLPPIQSGFELWYRPQLTINHPDLRRFNLFIAVMSIEKHIAKPIHKHPRYVLICVNIDLDVHSQSQSWYTHWIQGKFDRNPTIVEMAKSHGFWRIFPQINAHLVAQVFVSDHHHLRGYHPLNSLKCHEMSHKWKTIYSHQTNDFLTQNYSPIFTSIYV